LDTLIPPRADTCGPVGSLKNSIVLCPPATCAHTGDTSKQDIHTVVRYLLNIRFKNALTGSYIAER
jgi:hypothetical protein